MHYYLLFLSYALDALREIHFDSLHQKKSVSLKLDSKHSAKLPDDYVDFVKIGVVVGDKIRKIGKNESISDQLTERDTSLTDNQTYVGVVYWDNYFNSLGEYYGRIYGYGGGENVASYNMVNGNCVLKVNHDYEVDEIYLEYITDAYKPNVKSVVNPYASRAIQEYIKWQYKENNRKYGLSERQIARQEFYNQYRILRGRMSDLTTADILESVNSGIKRSIKT